MTIYLTGLVGFKLLLGVGVGLPKVTV